MTNIISANNPMQFGYNNNNMQSQNMIDNFKSMALTMAMVKGTSQSDSSGSMYNTVFIMLLVSFIDLIAMQIKRVFGFISIKMEEFICDKTNNIIIASDLGSLSPPDPPTKRASVIIKIEMGSKNPTSDAVIDLLTNLPHVKCILLKNGIFTVNYSDEIEISKGLFARITHTSTATNTANLTAGLHKPKPNAIGPNNSNNSESKGETSGSQSQSETDTEMGFIDIYSYTHSMDTIRLEINCMVKTFLIKMANKLGSSTYYFSEIPAPIYRDASGAIDYSKIPEHLHFSMKPFVTNRSFQNLFGKDIEVIRKRVEFFRDNKEWYDSKGVPYTLGIMVSGVPGSGKTSIIKCLANELDRHIINIHLSDSMTKIQLEQLFFNEQIRVLQNGKTETFTIPINKRIYVLEDVDCQCDVIKDRAIVAAEHKFFSGDATETDATPPLTQTNAVAPSRMTQNQKQNNLPQATDTSNQKITLSFLLNLLDGVLESPGRILYMTANYIDHIDRAFTRPGRIDIIAKLDYADHTQIINMIEHRYDATLSEEQKQRIHSLPHVITAAEVGRILFENFDDLPEALNELERYAATHPVPSVATVAPVASHPVPSVATVAPVASHPAPSAAFAATVAPAFAATFATALPTQTITESAVPAASPFTMASFASASSPFAPTLAPPTPGPPTSGPFASAPTFASTSSAPTSGSYTYQHQDHAQPHQHQEYTFTLAPASASASYTTIPLKRNQCVKSYDSI